jgi:hypothetical protein
LPAAIFWMIGFKLAADMGLPALAPR